MLFPEPGSLLWKEHSLVRPPSLAPSFSLVKLRVTLEQPSVPFFNKKKKDCYQYAKCLRRFATFLDQRST